MAKFLTKSGNFVRLSSIFVSIYAILSGILSVGGVPSHLKYMVKQLQTPLYGYKHETFSDGERTRSRRANKIEISSYERAVTASNTPRDATKRLISDDLSRQLSSENRQKGGRKEVDVLTGSELRKKAKELKTKKKGEKMKAMKLEKKHRLQLLETNTKNNDKIFLRSGIPIKSPKEIINHVENACVYMYPKMFREIVDEDDDDFDDIMGVKVYENAMGHIKTDQKANKTEAMDFINFCSEEEGWRNILTPPSSLQFETMKSVQEKLNYFTMCLTAQFITLTSHDPIDVNSFLTGHCWHDDVDEVLTRQYEALKAMMENWDAQKVSCQTVTDHTKMRVGCSSCISFHDGKHLGILAASICAFYLRSLHHDEELHGARFRNIAKDGEDIIERYMERYVLEYRFLVDKIIDCKNIEEKGKIAKELMKLSTIMTCNVQEIYQGFQSFFDTQDIHQRDTTEHFYQKEISGLMEIKRKYYLLSQHGYTNHYNGIFAAAKDICKLSGISLEDAQNQRGILKDAKVLRRYFPLQPPMAPWLEHYGRLIGSHPMLDFSDKVTVTKHILQGYESKTQQLGYLRVLRGLSEAINLQSITIQLDKNSQKTLKHPDVKCHLDLSEESFLGQKTKKVLDYILSE